MHTDTPRPGTGCGELLRAEISARGAISFARFMELALYAPGCGYYRTEDRPIGRAGDFYTSVSVGPVFGFLLAHRIARWARGVDCVEVIEAAAHDGRLAADVLQALRAFEPGVLERVRYGILEPFETRRRAQQEALAEWGSRVWWTDGWAGVERPIRGVVLANELLDAFPVHRFRWDKAGGCWWEEGVTLLEDGRLGFCRLRIEAETPGAGAGSPISAALKPDWPGALLEVLPDGFVAESSPGALAWWRAASARLGQGRLVTLDYGFEEGDRIRPERTEGTLRAYHRHRLEPDLLARPGEQDLTAHVDFPAVCEAGEGEGLVTEAFQEQGRWLGAVAVDVLRRGDAAAAWLAARSGQLRTLTHPVHLGRAMKVLVQARGGVEAAGGVRD